MFRRPLFKHRLDHSRMCVTTVPIWIGRVRTGHKFARATNTNSQPPIQIRNSSQAPVQIRNHTNPQLYKSATIQIHNRAQAPPPAPSPPQPAPPPPPPRNQIQHLPMHQIDTSTTACLPPNQHTPPFRRHVLTIRSRTGRERKVENRTR